MSSNSNTGNKLNRIQINFKCIIAEEVKNKPAAFSEANIPRPTLPCFRNHLTDENNQSKLSLGSARKPDAKTVSL